MEKLLQMFGHATVYMPEGAKGSSFDFIALYLGLVLVWGVALGLRLLQAIGCVLLQYP